MRRVFCESKASYGYLSFISSQSLSLCRCCNINASFCVNRHRYMIATLLNSKTPRSSTQQTVTTRDGHTSTRNDAVNTQEDFTAASIRKKIIPQTPGTCTVHISLHMLTNTLNRQSALPSLKPSLPTIQSIRIRIHPICRRTINQL